MPTLASPRAAPAPATDDRRTLQRAARIAGTGYLVIIACGLFAELVARGGLIVAGDAAATAANIAQSEMLFRTGIASDLVMLIADAVVAVALWVILVPFSRTAAFVVASFRLLHTAISGVNLVNLVLPLLLLSAAAPAGLAEGQAAALTGLFVEAHRYGYNLGLVFFAVHLAALAWVFYRTLLVPRFVALLLGVASLAYLVDGFISVLSPAYGGTAEWLMAPMVLGELSLCLWLLVAGVREPHSEPGRTGGGGAP